MPAEPMGERLLLWIDGVGGYLTCLNPTVTLGQAIPDSTVDIPLQADLSRLHARLSRHDDQYVLTPVGRTRVNGQPVTSDVVLADGDQVTLGATLVLRFRQPHPLSSSARLELVSSHRPWPAADGIVLMSQSLVLGPSLSSHIVCKDWAREVILARKSPTVWMCRTSGHVEVNGKTCTSPAEIDPRARVCGEDFCFTLEPLG